MKYFVYYHDDYYDNGGVGLTEFDGEAPAMRFIESRMRQVYTPNIDSYAVIKGERLSLEVVSRITSVRVK